MQKISSRLSQPLYSVAATRQWEQQRAAGLPPHALMRRAGLAVAQLTLALAPHARRIWIACGPGNNGGDGFEAALQLHQWGKPVELTWTGPIGSRSELPPDAEAARARALAAGLAVAQQPPSTFDFCIDALMGIGGRLVPDRPGSTCLLDWLHHLDASGMPRLAVDVPTGLDADTGVFTPGAGTGRPLAGRGRRFTLSLLTLKPGLFTASGRDQAGEVWFDDLGANRVAPEPVAWLLGADRALPGPGSIAAHASHKGSFGDVAVLGGQSTPGHAMTGAALLAARAALHAGAGRVFVALVGTPAHAAVPVDLLQPELMFQSPDTLKLGQQVLVCGCGGGMALRPHLPRLLSAAPQVVLDADALNAVAADTALQTLLQARGRRAWSTVLTPHPLEAARLLGITTAGVQADRLGAARELAQRFDCVVVLKGSGTVIASPDGTPFVNASGNALLATAGTGDVLAGVLGACLARGMPTLDAACAAVFSHGHAADCWRDERPGQALTASALAQAFTGLQTAP